MTSKDSIVDQKPENRLWAIFYLKLIKPVLTVKDTPHALALGIAIGLWISLTPTVGIQMTLVFVLGTIFKANRIAGVAMTWISNPVTFLPMYYGYYLIGLWPLGQEPISYATLQENAAEISGWDLVVYYFDVLGKPLWVGSLLVATVVALPAYPLCRRYFERREQKRRDLREVKPSNDRQTVTSEGN